MTSVRPVAGRVTTATADAFHGQLPFPIRRGRPGDGFASKRARGRVGPVTAKARSIAIRRCPGASPRETAHPRCNASAELAVRELRETPWVHRNENRGGALVCVHPAPFSVHRASRRHAPARRRSPDARLPALDRAQIAVEARAYATRRQASPGAGYRGCATSRRRRVTASPAIAQSPVQPRRRTRNDTRHVRARTRPDEPRGEPLRAWDRARWTRGVRPAGRSWRTIFGRERSLGRWIDRARPRVERDEPRAEHRPARSIGWPGWIAGDDVALRSARAGRRRFRPPRLC
jgi:hypothetical protein